MLGCYDFCGHYDWTFEWLRREGGEPLVRRYWEEAIGGDSQRHAAGLIVEKGFEGMREYWSHTLAEEAAGYAFTEKPGLARIDMHECPSKGFLLRNGLQFYHDYCDHCMGWVGPVMRKAGFFSHEHARLFLVHCSESVRAWHPPWEMKRARETETWACCCLPLGQSGAQAPSVEFSRRRVFVELAPVFPEVHSAKLGDPEPHRREGTEVGMGFHAFPHGMKIGVYAKSSKRVRR